ncbi:preprotein translocase subunit YajC [Clostridium akagii]|uniref:preprotein translocase subunit YajC n=1 Tax=Clostridium akagii TaxID=91623 RepID=UPI00047D5151|nr:preprotein translocase subunit YajC [Clostridium akagii]
MSSTVITIIYVAIIFGFTFLMIIFPERKRKKKFSEMMNTLKVNDDVVTTGGIVGKVTNIQDDFVIIQSGPDKARIKILKKAISNITTTKIAE